MFSFCFFALCFLFSNLSDPCTEVAIAGSSTFAFEEEVKRAIEQVTGPIMGPASKNDMNAIQGTLEKVLSEAEKEGKPIRFGVGILNRDGLAVAGRYIVGTFKVEDFSKYHFVTKAFKQKKIIQDRLYFQGGSELLIICVPLLQQKEVVGAVVLGFDPSQIKMDYGLTTQQFMAINFNK
jgi:hypothetical protein